MPKKSHKTELLIFWMRFGKISRVSLIFCDLRFGLGGQKSPCEKRCLKLKNGKVHTLVPMAWFRPLWRRICPGPSMSGTWTHPSPLPRLGLTTRAWTERWLWQTSTFDTKIKKKILPSQFDSFWCTAGRRRCRRLPWRQRARRPARPWLAFVKTRLETSEEKEPEMKSSWCVLERKCQLRIRDGLGLWLG